MAVKQLLYMATSLLTLQSATTQRLQAPVTPDHWKHMSIYQVVTDRFALSPLSNGSGDCSAGAQTYCGGTFQGIVSKLDYIQGMGFDAIWISPVVANIGGDQSYHGYWAQDLYTINPNFGTADDLRALSSALHGRGMSLMVDVVANHMGPQSTNAPDTSEYAQAYTPFNDRSHFHTYCTIRNYNDQNEVEQCWLGASPQDALADLNTENAEVATLLTDWVHALVRDYSIDGLRIDTVKHVRQTFWPAFVQAAGVYCTGEVWSGDAEYVAQYQRISGLQGLLNYPLFYPLIRTFQARAQGFDELKNMVTNTLRTQFPDPMALTNFFENHDNPRFPSLFASPSADLALVKNAITFLLTGDGIPIIYYGQEQMFNGGQDPYNREALWRSNYNTSSEIYVHIAKLNRLRKEMTSSYRQSSEANPITVPLTSLYNDQTAWAYHKAHLVVVLSSDGGSSTASQNITVASPNLAQGTVLVDILTCKADEHIVVADQGRMDIQLKHGEPIVLYPVSLLAGSGICAL